MDQATSLRRLSLRNIFQCDNNVGPFRLRHARAIKRLLHFCSLCQLLSIEQLVLTFWVGAPDPSANALADEADRNKAVHELDTSLSKISTLQSVVIHEEDWEEEGVVPFCQALPELDKQGIVTYIGDDSSPDEYSLLEV